MSDEQEDFNAFDSWDCLGATTMLGLTPAIMNFVFNDKDIVSTLALAGIGGAIAVAVFLLSIITRWRLIGIILNWAGLILTFFYIAVAVKCWVFSDPEDAPAAPAAQEEAH